MWIVILALTLVVSTVASLVFGRLLGRASAEQTRSPDTVRGPALETALQIKRLEIAEQAAGRRTVEVHLN